MQLTVHHLFFLQIKGLQVVTVQLRVSGLGSEVQPVRSHGTGPQSEQTAGFRGDAAEGVSAEPQLQTGDSRVSARSSYETPSYLLG